MHQYSYTDQLLLNSCLESEFLQSKKPIMVKMCHESIYTEGKKAGFKTMLEWWESTDFKIYTYSKGTTLRNVVLEFILEWTNLGYIFVHSFLFNN